MKHRGEELVTKVGAPGKGEGNAWRSPKNFFSGARILFVKIVLSLSFYFPEHRTERHEQNPTEDNRAEPERPGGLNQGRGYRRDRAERRIVTVWCQRH